MKFPVGGWWSKLNWQLDVRFKLDLASAFHCSTTTEVASCQWSRAAGQSQGVWARVANTVSDRDSDGSC
jgi:hypothetical protein